MLKKLIVSDIDETLISEDDTSFNTKSIVRLKKHLCRHPKAGIVYATGRHLEFALFAIKTFDLPKPLYLICDVGTAIYRQKKENWELISAYKNTLSGKWPSKEKIKNALFGIQIDEQEPEKQTEFKQSYYFDLREDEAKIKNKISAALTREKLDCNVIVSKDEKKGHGLIDILPHDTAKHNAIYYLKDKKGINEENIIFAGDSGNDIGTLTSGLRAVVVNNADSYVKKKVYEIAAQKNILDKVFFSTKKFADGVIEGAKYFNIF